MRGPGIDGDANKKSVQCVGRNPEKSRLRLSPC